MGMVHAATICVAACTVVLSGVTTLTAESDADGTSRFIPHAEEPLHDYRALCRMHAWNDRFDKEGWLEAWTTLHDGRFEYRIISERGSESVRKRVLREILEREQKLIESGNSDRGALTPENYDFAAAAPGANGVTVVPITPRRKDVLLVDGRMVLDSSTGDLLRVEGRLAKNPSFWTSLVKVVRHYARLAGVRVPVATESTAKIKFIGTSQLEISYEYERINGQPVSLAEARR